MIRTLLTLEAWAQARYEKPPSIHTLRRWVREAKISPKPEKNGRSYFVQQDATYVDWSLNESPPQNYG
jgi:predicted site-specific integrase-resolvase